MDGTMRAIRWNWWGIIPMALLGAGWHFLYTLCGQWQWIGYIAPVNESVWEHVKIIFWPQVIWWLLGLYVICPRGMTQTKQATWRARGFGRWIAGLALACISAIVLMIAGYYTYKGITGIESVFADIVLFVLALIAGQWIGIRIFQRISVHIPGRIISCMVILLLSVLLAIWTNTPPNLPLFWAT